MLNVINFNRFPIKATFLRGIYFYRIRLILRDKSVKTLFFFLREYGGKFQVFNVDIMFKQAGKCYREQRGNKT
jgi:hypothetical protein